MVGSSELTLMLSSDLEPSWCHLWIMHRVVDLEPTKIKTGNRELIICGIIDELSIAKSSVVQ